MTHRISVAGLMQLLLLCKVPHDLVNERFVGNNRQIMKTGATFQLSEMKIRNIYSNEYNKRSVEKGQHL